MRILNKLKYFSYRHIFSKINSVNSPDSSVVKIRVWLLKDLISSIGHDVNIQSGVIFKGNLHNLTIGNNSGIGLNSSLHLTGKLNIGNDVMIGEHLTVHTSNHGTSKDYLLREQSSIVSNVEIGDDVWIGSNVIILPGVKICSGSVVGAGSVVTKNVDSNTIVAGNPARLIRVR